MSIEEYSEASAAQWKAIVRLAFRCNPGRTAEMAATIAKQTQSRKATVKRKIDAILFKRSEGWDEQAIVAAGQGPTLSSYAKHQQNGHEKQRVLSWRVSKSLADAIMSSETSPDQDEALASRLVRVLGMQTSEQFWEFLHSVFADLSDSELKNLAGAFTEKDAPRRRKK